jgi:hypothetical protein
MPAVNQHPFDVGMSATLASRPADRRYLGFLRVSTLLSPRFRYGANAAIVKR